MEVIHRCRTFSIIANLNKLESFILHDSTAQQLYQQHLRATLPESRKANHIPFFSDIINLGEKGNCSEASESFKLELNVVLEKYIAADSELLLDVPHERLDQVRRNIQKDLTLSSFKPVIKEVVRDLAFVYMDGFINSESFREFRENELADVDFTAILAPTVQEKDSTNKLRKFFGDKFLHTGSSFSLFRDQPTHVKDYKLSKLFGERIGVEKVGLLEAVQQDDEEEHLKRRDRRLHIFFGDNFEVEETMFNARVQVPRFVSTAKEFPKQPDHVNTFRLTKFFGERPPTCEDLFQDTEASGSDSSEDERPTLRRLHSQRQHINRFFGERMDPEQEAKSVSFAQQPENVKATTLKKIFGESAAHTINFDASAGGTWPPSRTKKSRSKLEKFFGPFEG